MAFPVRRSVGIVGALVSVIAVLGVATSSSRTSAAGIDFSRNPEANNAAAGGPLSADLAAFDGYAGNWISRFGIEVELVGRPTDPIRAVVARDTPQYQGKPVPVRYHSVRHSMRELQALTERIFTDNEYWNARGVELSSWGPDVEINKIHITMAHYTKAYRDALFARYGSDWVTVDPHDVQNVGS